MFTREIFDIGELKINYKNGISLITLIITIVVITIISGTSILLLAGEGGVINSSVIAVKEQEVATIKELLNLELGLDEGKIKEIRYYNVEETDEILKSYNKSYEHKIGVYRNKPVYLGEEDSEDATFLKERDFDVVNMTPDEFKYYIEMGILEDSVKEIKYIGRQLQTDDFSGTIKIGNNVYGLGWYLIGNYTDNEKENNTYQEHYEDLKLKDITHAPYLVNYETGVVLSIDGMIMYKSQVLVHSFNDNYDENLSSAVTYVNSFTEKTGDSYGNLISTSKYTGNVDNYGGGMSIYKDNEGKLQYDEEGALILDADNAIPVLEIDNKFKIEDNYSINVTVEGDYMQKSVMANDFYPNTIVALSESSQNYLSWIGVYKGYLHIYSYYTGAALSHIDKEDTRKGFVSIDISKYQGKPINIQVVATRGGNVDVYINGEKIRTFEAGNRKMDFKYTTLGDLRVGRNLKFVGKIYEFGIYGLAISENSVEENWQRATRYVNK